LVRVNSNDDIGNTGIWLAITVPFFQVEKNGSLAGTENEKRSE
jgi:hypothetical protein